MKTPIKRLLFFLPLIATLIFCVVDTVDSVPPVPLHLDLASDGRKVETHRIQDGWAAIDSAGLLRTTTRYRSARWPVVTLAILNFNRWIMDAAYAEPKLMGTMFTMPELQEWDGGMNDTVETYADQLAKTRGEEVRRAEGKKAPPAGATLEDWKKSIEQLVTEAEQTEREQQLARLKGYRPVVQNRYNAWNLALRNQVRLTIAGHVFETLAPFDVNSPTVNGSGQDSFNLFVFKVQPGDSEREEWGKLVRMMDARCQAPITIALKVGDNWLRLPTAINSNDRRFLNPADQAAAKTPPTPDSNQGQQFTLWLRPSIMQALAIGAALQVLVLIVVVGWHSNVLRDARDPRLQPTQQAPWSLSRVTLAWWLMLCTASYLYVWAMTDNVNNLSGSAVMLLGINGATLLFATSREPKATASTPPAPPTPPATPVAPAAPRSPVASKDFLNDLVSEGGEPEVSRVQMLVWNGVLGIVFAWQTVATWTMPTFDATLMTLLGISSTAYVGFKFTK